MEADPDGRPTAGGQARAGGRDLLFAAIEATRLPIVLSDPNLPDDPIVLANRAFVRMSGYDRSEIVGRNCRFLQGPGSDPDTVDLIRRAVRARGEIAVELLNYRKDGTPFWNALFLSPVFAPGGDLVYFFASQLDMSRHRDAQEALRWARQAEAVGRLTGGVAHDFNNLLQVIAGHVDGLKAQAAASGDARLARRVGAIGEAADRAVALTQRLLAFSREHRLDAQAIDLDALASGVATRLDGGAGGVAAVGLAPPPAALGAAVPETGDRPAGRRGTERILVVDDRPEIAELARTMLEGLGHRVDVAKDGLDALARLRDGFDLLFSDMVMPGELDGVALARQAQALHPGLRVLLTTGYADPAAGFDTIAKPYRRTDLARAIRAVLDRPAGTG